MKQPTILYFAYGSNMLPRRLRARAPSARLVDTAVLPGRELRFHKVGTDGSGKCDIPVGRGDSRVYGVLFELATVHKVLLDEIEGLGQGYREEAVEVSAGSGPRLALAYRAIRIDPGLRPYRWYRDFVVEGAIEHALPASYVEWLTRIRSDPDPDPRRRAENESILRG